MAVVAVTAPFLVNEITSFKQYRPTITALATGGFVVGWQDESGLGSLDGSDDIRFARYDALGLRLTADGTDTLANTTTDGAQFDPSIAGFADGKFVMVWTDASGTSPDFNNRAVRGQVFNSDGTKSGSEFIVNSTFPLSQDEPSVTVLTNGKFIVTWSGDDVNASSTQDIIGRLFNANGTPAGAEFTINVQKVGDQVSSEVHALSTGGFAVVWDDTENTPVTGNQIKTFIRFYNASGTATSTALVANSSAAGLPQEVDVAELSDGRIVVTYSDYDFNTSDGSGSAVRARIYNPATSTFGSVINVNTTTSNDQLDAQVAALDGGQFVVVWTDKSTSGGDTSFEAVRLQVFNSSGGKVGGELLVNTATNFEQRNPAVTVLTDGRFVVSWEDNSQTGDDTDGFAIRSRIYDARIVGIDLDGTSAADKYQGSNFSDIIDGLAGNDTLYGGGGIDFLFGGIGSDVLRGEDGDDELEGGADNDALKGGGGADTLDGGAGGDLMSGGDGNDTYYVDSANDSVSEQPNQGYDTVNTTLNSYTLPDNVERVNFIGVGNFIGTGNNLANRFQGGVGDDRFVDVLGGGDIFSGNAGTDTIDFRTSATGAVINMSTLAHAGAAAGDSYSGIEKFLGSNTAADTMTGGGTGRWVFVGGGGGDTLNGGVKNDQLIGGANNDTLKGNGDRDSLDGGIGNDTMTGGAAGDVFVYIDAAFGHDTITDYQDGLDNFKIFSAVADNINDFIIGGNGTTSVTLTRVGAPTNFITIQGAAPITITADDFVFY